jgi:hypothetical protein
LPISFSRSCASIEAGTLDSALKPMHLDYVSCLLTVISTVLVGKRLWHGWILAGLNSVIICLIGFQTGQGGFIPANIFCLMIYAYNIRKWRKPQTKPTGAESPITRSSVVLDAEPRPLLGS